jgi:hypothetical protein
LAALRAALGDKGSTLVWSGFEEANFRELRDALLREENYDDDVRWLDRLLLSGLVDQYELCLKSYIHPKMGGKASIKAVLPAVWSEDTPAKRQKPFDAYPQQIDPYSFLKESGCLSDGVGAMVGYVTMLSQTGSEREKTRRDLLRYCAVDTAAEVIIYLHWLHLLKLCPRVGHDGVAAVNPMTPTTIVAAIGFDIRLALFFPTTPH